MRLSQSFASTVRNKSRHKSEKNQITTMIITDMLDSYGWYAWNKQPMEWSARIFACHELRHCGSPNEWWSNMRNFLNNPGSKPIKFWEASVHRFIDCSARYNSAIYPYTLVKDDVADTFCTDHRADEMMLQSSVCSGNWYTLISTNTMQKIVGFQLLNRPNHSYYETYESTPKFKKKPWNNNTKNSQ